MVRVPVIVKRTKPRVFDPISEVQSVVDGPRRMSLFGEVHDLIAPESIVTPLGVIGVAPEGYSNTLVVVQLIGPYAPLVGVARKCATAWGYEELCLAQNLKGSTKAKDEQKEAGS